MKCQIKHNPWIISACIFQCNTLPDKKCSSASIEIGRTWAFTWQILVWSKFGVIRNNTRANNAHMLCSIATVYKEQREMCSVFNLFTVFTIVWVDLLASDVKCYQGALRQNIFKISKHVHIQYHQFHNSTHTSFLSGLEVLLYWEPIKWCDVNYLFFIPQHIHAKDCWCANLILK